MHTVIVLLFLSVCKTPLGVEYSNHHSLGAVKDEQMVASSEDGHYPARFGRRDHKFAWCANKDGLNDPMLAKSQFLQIDFVKLKQITAILTQGLGLSSVVKKYYLYYAADPMIWHSYRHKESNELVVSILFIERKILKLQSGHDIM